MCYFFVCIPTSSFQNRIGKPDRKLHVIGCGEPGGLPLHAKSRRRDREERQVGGTGRRDRVERQGGETGRRDREERQGRETGTRDREERHGGGQCSSALSYKEQASVLQPPPQHPVKDCSYPPFLPKITYMLARTLLNTRQHLPELLTATTENRPEEKQSTVAGIERH